MTNRMKRKLKLLVLVPFLLGLILSVSCKKGDSLAVEIAKAMCECEKKETEEQIFACLFSVILKYGEQLEADEDLAKEVEKWLEKNCK